MASNPQPGHLGPIQEDQEHGRTWSTCLHCGAQWNSDDEQITDGDESCADALTEESAS